MKQHTPVMVLEILSEIGDYIEINHSRNIDIFDGTLGHAGHMIKILERYGDKISHYVGTDIDKQMFQVAKTNIDKYISASKISSDKVIIKNVSYVDIVGLSKELELKYDIVFLDLGVNLWHFKIPDRGFSIKDDGLLDMRFDTSNSKLRNAEWIINNYKQDQLEEVMIDGGEFSQRMAHKIADQIISYRYKNPIKTTYQLIDILSQIGIGTKKSAVVFQAIRLEVNKEMNAVESFLSQAQNVLKKDGILIILTYHSIEDRTVKNYFRCKDNHHIEAVNKHVIKPSYQEIKQNLPSRSAKMRVFKKV